jgi:hypothetical protein
LPSTQTKDSVVYFVTTSYDFVINTLKNLTDLRFDEVVSQQMPAAVRSETRLVGCKRRLNTKRIIVTMYSLHQDARHQATRREIV